MSNFYESINANKIRSSVIIALFAIFVGFVAYVIGRAMDYGPGFFGIALIMGGLTSFISYWYSDKIILSLSSARPANKEEDRYFISVAQNLALAARVPVPKLYVIDDSAMNAFATGRDPDHAVICCTSGLLQRLDRTELEGVVAHEMSHIGNYDMRLMSVVTIMVGFITLLADWFLRASFWGGRKSEENKNSGQLQAIFMVAGIVLALLSPLIAQLMQLALSRRREYLADITAVKLTRQPSGLINALRKLDGDREPLEAANKATAHLYISNPLKNHHDGIGWFANLFSTHPPISDRIKALERLS